MPATISALSEMTPAAARASPSRAQPSGQELRLPDGTPQDRPRSHHRPRVEDTSGDADFARRLQDQLNAESAAEATGAPVAVPVPAPAPAPAVFGDYDSDFRRQAAAAASGVAGGHLSDAGRGAMQGDGVLRQGAHLAPIPAPAPAPARREPAPAPAPAPAAPAVAAAGAAAGAVWPGCRTERACRYEYNSATKQWTREDATITVVVHDKQFGEGGLRNVRQMREVDPVDGSYIEYVAKWFKYEVSSLWDRSYGFILSTSVIIIGTQPCWAHVICDATLRRQINGTGTLPRPKRRWLQRSCHENSTVCRPARRRKSGSFRSW